MLQIDRGDPQAAAVMASVFAFSLPLASKDAVLLGTFNPGSYTAVASSVTGTAGVVILEIYEIP